MSRSLHPINPINLPIYERLYQDYLSDPNSIAPEWRDFFAQLPEDERTQFQAQTAPQTFNASLPKESFEFRVSRLIDGFRRYGHLLADINPLANKHAKESWQLTLERYGLSVGDLNRKVEVGNFLLKENATLQELIDALYETYCGKIGIEYFELQSPEVEEWIQQRVEPTHFRPTLTIDDKRLILDYLNQSEVLENFIHTKFTGQKRFSIEGGETLIPILAACIEKAADVGVKEIVLGMAHRGRINVLSNILKKSYKEIFAEFEDLPKDDTFEGSGDVKYHKGFQSKWKSINGSNVDLTLTPNPSHLEAVAPVVLGMVRAKQIHSGNELKQDQVVPIIIHGDASIAGQGVVYESMQLSKLSGYSTGGSIHIVVNNQIGFTTLPKDSRSMQYCTDIAKAFGAPVFHVNGEDPEGCVYAMSLAMEVRQLFHCDVFIDLNCYRKYGHNESDEPAFTQPHEYKIIRSKRPIREVYRDSLIQQGVLEKQVAQELEEDFKRSLNKALNEAKKAPVKKKVQKLKKKDLLFQEKSSAYFSEFFKPVKTEVSLKTLRAIGKKMLNCPEGFTMHKSLKRIMQQRLQMLDPKSSTGVDWAMGEALAFGTLLMEKCHIRLSGQDARRGTFSHRHSMWVDQDHEQKYFPLNHLGENQGRFDVFNSPLSEFAVLGFDFGYSLTDLNQLILWEAQFGDFANGAQVIIDQFISSTEQKWGQSSRITMLLPHGFEGQGPEHSSARIERYLSLCGDGNMIIANPTTPAQIFHLLRRQYHSNLIKPLVIFTPKGLLRHPQCISSLDELTKGSFQEIIDEKVNIKAKALVFCSGRNYYDLVAFRDEHRLPATIIRIEQLYPFNQKLLDKIIKKHKGYKKVLWIQDEPKNMGSWWYIQPYLKESLNPKDSIIFIGRKTSASPAAGSLSIHQQESQAILNAFKKEVTELSRRK